MDASLMTKGGAMVFALVLGVLAGLITTVAGLGGGLILAVVGMR
jgi:Na+-translocating ferredoxin:NAD+ oxidoreductase RnfD subunit